MKRAAYIFAIVAVLLLADGLYLELSNNQQGCGCNGDSGTLFGGSTSIALSTGTEVLIGAGFLLIVAIIIYVWVLLRARAGLSGAAGQARASQAQASQAQAVTAQAGQAEAAAMAPAGESQEKTEVTAGQGQPRKESGDQH